MKMRLFFPLFLLVLLFTAGHAYAADPGMANKIAKPGDDGRYLQMANNFFIIYDPSDSMDVPYKDTGLTRLEAEKLIIRKSNATLPDLGWQTGLYPHWKGGLWLHGSPMAFKPYYELKRYDQADYARAIEQLPVKPTGPPMIQRGLMKIEHLLALPGRTEVFIFSDGKHSTAEELEPEPVEQARMLAEKYDVCFNIISSAVTAEEIKMLNDIASVNNCSQVIDFDTVFEKPEHLFGKLFMDPEQVGFSNILFDFDKHDIKPEFKSTLDTLGRYLLDQPNTYVVLSGFCDSIGSEEYNDKLSKRRAESVRNYLSRQFKIDNDRMLSYWYGFANPVASNATEEGRALNRRVTIALRPGK
ncbi:MAG: OmpA family protein [Desulfobulbaceae bacterium]|nr:OmpA family protein [Desulfobulbaceae bacterium]